MGARLAILVLITAFAVGPPLAGAQEEDQVIPLAPIDVNAPWPLIPPTPKVITRPAYPETARRHEEQGTVELVVKVLRDGSVGEVTVKKSSGFHILDEAAIAEAKRWQFVPGHRGPKTLDAFVEVPVRFQLVE
jgi:periplasmic protein TonB